MEAIGMTEGQQYGLGPCPVTLIPHYYVPMPDGVKLSLKIWFPSSNVSHTCFSGFEERIVYQGHSDSSHRNADTMPAILEVAPYRKSDCFIIRDNPHHLWFSSHGYICVRMDLRGCGDSQGLYFDEYTKQEQDDICHMIGWLSNQSWCNGNVGMIGESYGGFSALIAASQQPPGLKTIITVYSTDDRYATDTKFLGGCLLVCDLIIWEALFLIVNATPPCPRFVSDWKELWTERLQKQAQPWMHTWIKHQLRDEYWHNGSICEDYRKVKCPVLAIGSWHDGYTNAVFRMIENLPSCRGLIGPWSHEYPDITAPDSEPEIDFLGECLKWWDCHLKGIDNHAMDAPAMRAYIQDSIIRQPYMSTVPGEWVPVKKSQLVKEKKLSILIPGENSLHPEECTDGQKIRSEVQNVRFSSQSGYTNFVWVPHGDGDFPMDQHLEDSQSLSWTTDELQSDITICGISTLHCSVSVGNSNQGVLAARLCDVSEDGKSSLLTYGVLNLTHRDGHSPAKVADLKPGHPYKVILEFKAIGTCIKTGHRLRLSVSSNYWPMIWPANSNDPIEMAIHLGCMNGPSRPVGYKTALHLPILEKDVNGVFSWPNVPLVHDVGERKLVPVSLHVERQPDYQRSASVDMMSGQYSVERKKDWGRTYLHDTGTIFDYQQKTKYTIEDDKPLSAKACSEGILKFEWPELDSAPCTEIDAVFEMWADGKHFFMSHSLKALLNGEVVHENSWLEKEERLFV